jgi:hypothetical protein
MRAIDIHAHLGPQSLWHAADVRTDWYGFRHEAGDGVGSTVRGGKCSHFTSPKVRFTPEERRKDRDAQGLDVQVSTSKRQDAHEHLATAPTMYREMDMRFWLEKTEAD